MEVIQGEIVRAGPDGLLIRAPYQDWERFATRQYGKVEIGLMDGRTITPEQRRKAYALLGEIAAWSGYDVEEAKLTTKHDYITSHLEGLQKELFSLSDCDVTTARGYIDYLVDFIISFGVPCKRPLAELCEDVQKYVYACCTHKVCAVCGKTGEIHHVDRIGMGGDRKSMDHTGMACLPLCRAHHMQAHDMGDAPFMRWYHLESVPIDDRIAKIHHLGGKRRAKTDGYRKSNL